MRFIVCFLFFITLGCETGDLKVIADLPVSLHEASGITYDNISNTHWIINDGGNKPILYNISSKGEIIKEIWINAKNRDWEDLANDTNGNIYIGDFGNNDNDSKNLSILIIKNTLLNNDSITPEIISFKYPDQKKFPPKKKDRHFDCESFFYYRDSLYLFTKSRYGNAKGKTNLYSLPAKKGQYEAKYINTFNTCDYNGCWVTSSSINESGDKVALLTEHSVFVFSDFNSTDFLKSNFKQYSFNHNSQKESVCFKNDSTLIIADEFRGIDGGNLYEFKIN